jgi:hypothetical protein
MNFSDLLLDPAAPLRFVNLYRTDLCDAEDGGYEALNTTAPPSRKSLAFLPDLQGATADGSCAAFEAVDQLTPDASSEPASDAPSWGGTNAQLYKSCEGQLSLISVLPNGEASKEDSALGTGGGNNIRTDSVANALSEDGRRAYWTAAPLNAGKLYVRAQLGTEGEEETLPVSGTVSTKANARFWAASEDGSKALFTIEDDTIPAINHNLYEFRLTEEEGELLTEKP